MYLSYEETISWIREIRERAPELGGVGVFVLPTFPALKETHTILEGSGILHGAQDTHWEPSGSFTGEVSPEVLREIGCTIVEIGHAERRTLFGETDEIIRRKTRAVLKEGLVPLICVGEPSRTDVESAAEFVIEQIQKAVDLEFVNELALADQNRVAVMVAYEPIWAIGADRSAPAEYIKSIVKVIRSELSAWWPGQSMILYGGAVDAENAGTMKETGVDGLFVGRAALNIDDFLEIISAFQAREYGIHQ